LNPNPRSLAWILQLEETRIEKLEAQIQRKDEVLAAVTEELVRTKKELGEDWRTTGLPQTSSTR